MVLCKVSFSLLCVLGLVIVGRVALAQDSPADYLKIQNAARSEVGDPNLVWDETVAAFARNYTKQRKGDCKLVHSGGGGRYGECLAMSPVEMSGIDASKMWVGEKPNYDYASNSCVGGRMCGHYTQVVWKKTLRIGCAKVRCDNGGTFISCNYEPPGNYLGERPY